MKRDPLTNLIIGCGIEVHRVLGPGLLESVYEECLCFELSRISIEFNRQVSVPVEYKSNSLDCGFRADLLVEGSVIVELKAVDKFLPIHQGQLLTYMKLAGLKTGLLINFNVVLLRDGIKRMVL